MTDLPLRGQVVAMGKRVDRAAKVIAASPQRLYRALIDPSELVAWLPPRGMKGEIHSFDPRPGGRYSMTLSYDDTTAQHGKSTDHSDVVQGQFLELIPDQSIVQLFEFESADPAFAGHMKMTWSLQPVAAGTQVSISCEDVPSGISPEDHAAGMASSLENLAEFVGA